MEIALFRQALVEHTFLAMVVEILILHQDQWLLLIGLSAGLVLLMFIMSQLYVLGAVVVVEAVQASMDQGMVVTVSLLIRQLWQVLAVEAVVEAETALAEVL
jgi:hypothetical protein